MDWSSRSDKHTRKTSKYMFHLKVREQPIRTGTLHHAPVGRVRDGVDVWGHLVPLLALVHVDDVLAVDGKVLVGIYHHAEETGVGLGDKGRGRGHTPSILRSTPGLFCDASQGADSRR